MHRKLKILKMRHFLACHKFSCTIFFKLSLKYLLELFFVLFIVVNKVKTKDSYIKEFDQFSKKNSHSQGVAGSPEMIFQIPALFKECKDLHET